MGSLHFFGGAKGVTGSKSLVTTEKGRKFLIDCGLFQGTSEIRQQNWQPPTFDFKRIDAVILTHAHIDHTGYLPILSRFGFTGPIYCSKGTRDLCEVLLRDAAYLEEELAEFANKTHYSHHDPAEPMFNKKDVERVLSQFHAVDRYKWIELSEDCSFELSNAGHIIGASQIKFALRYDHSAKYIGFSGDLGNERSLTIKPPDPPPTELSTLVLESTYGNRLHSNQNTSAKLREIIEKTLRHSGVLIIPAFAVGRAQEVLYRIKKLEDEGMKTYPVVLDSPMSSRATEIFLAHPEDHHLDSAFQNHPSSLLPKHFEIAQSPDESLMTCMRDGPMIVVSAAGMLSGGRVLHHLKRRLPVEGNAVLFAGYQAEGTKGRFLQDNALTSKTLRIHHEDVPISADICTIDSMSSHADFSDTIKWLQNATSRPKRIILNHGSEAAQKALSERITKELGIPTFTAFSQQNFDL